MSTSPLNHLVRAFDADTGRPVEAACWVTVRRGRPQLRCTAPGYVDRETLATSTNIAMVSAQPWVCLDKVAYRQGDTVRVLGPVAGSCHATIRRLGAQSEPIHDLGELHGPADPVLRGSPMRIADELAQSASVVVGDWAPGLYCLDIARNGVRHSSLPFVVESPKAGQSGRLVVVANTCTWNAYNYWGGRSRYRVGATLAERPWDRAVERVRRRLARSLSSRLDWRHGELPFSRPRSEVALTADDPSIPFLSHLAASEWRLLAWLEREGLAYDLVTDLHLASQESIAQASAIMLNTHSEYWTTEGIDAIESVNRRGVAVINLSGNALYASVAVDAGERSMHCTAIRIPGDRGQRLLGVATAPEHNVAGPLDIGDRQHRFLRHLDASISTIGGECLNVQRAENGDYFATGRVAGDAPGNGDDELTGEGACGWEVDIHNGDDSFDVLASGSIEGARADVVVREPHGDQGLVFSFGSITAVGSLLVDPALAQMIRNVLDDVGAGGTHA